MWNTSFDELRKSGEATNSENLYSLENIFYCNTTKFIILEYLPKEASEHDRKVFLFRKYNFKGISSCKILMVIGKGKEYNSILLS